MSSPDLPATAKMVIVYQLLKTVLWLYSYFVDGMNITTAPVPGVPQPPKLSFDNSSKSSSSSSSSSSRAEVKTTSSSSSTTEDCCDHRPDNGTGGEISNVGTKKVLLCGWRMLAGS